MVVHRIFQLVFALFVFVDDFLSATLDIYQTQMVYFFIDHHIFWGIQA
jgi:hypothetical protein